MFMKVLPFRLADRSAASENPLYRDRPLRRKAQSHEAAVEALRLWTHENGKGGRCTIEVIHFL
jgi:hypothetical protein